MNVLSQNKEVKSQKVLVITGDPIGAKIAGPAIRAWNMALLLSEKHKVKLISMAGVSTSTEKFEVVHIPPFDNKQFNKFEAWADVIIFQGQAMTVFRSLRNTRKILVVDIYDPMHLEQLEQARNLDFDSWCTNVQEVTRVLNQQLSLGDFFLCASEKQKSFWLGQLAALGRINPFVYQNDPNLDGLLAVVPFGLPRTPPIHSRDALRGVVEGISDKDKILIWSGGLYNWFDPLTLIRAVASLSKKNPEVKLFFQGTKHPHPDVPEMEIVSESRKLARELGVLDSNVFFNVSWVEFEDRQNYLLEANAGVTTHHNHVETTYSFRTRILDYLWAQLPIVSTEGDHFAELVSTEGLGIAVPAENVEELVAALEKILFDQGFITSCQHNLARVRTGYYWDVVLKPLIDFVDNPTHAADWSITRAANRGGVVALLLSIRNKYTKAKKLIRNEGVRKFASKILLRMR